LAFVTINEEVGYGGQYLEPKTRSERATGEPAYKSKEPLYATATLGAKQQKFLMVLDSSTGSKRGHDTLWFDADCDGKFTEKEKFTGVPYNDGYVFGPIKVMVDCHGHGHEKCPQWFLVQFSEYEGGVINTGDGDGAGERTQVYRRIQLCNAGYYEGVVRFGDKEMLIGFVDADGNGLYNSVMKPDDEQRNDRLLLDLNGDGKLDGKYNSEESQPLGRFVEVGGKYWQIDPSPDGSSVAISPLDRPLGQVKADVKDYTLLLTSEDGVLQVRSKDGYARVPAGKYRLYQCNYKTTLDGKAWTFRGQCRTGEPGATIDVPPDGELRIPFGAPLVPKIQVSKAGSDLNLNLELRGAGGEVYNDVQMGENYQRPPVPKVRILAADDKELALLDFHYG
jgi:hypothetical protein